MTVADAVALTLYSLFQVPSGRTVRYSPQLQCWLEMPLGVTHVAEEDVDGRRIFRLDESCMSAIRLDLYDRVTHFLDPDGEFREDG